MKQHPAAIEKVGSVFYLSEGEKQFLLSCDIGEGLFFAGNNHVAIKVAASPQEHQLITSKPQEILERNAAKSAQPASIPPRSVIQNKIEGSLPPRFKSEIIVDNGTANRF